jgi:sarcosine oxidase subunit beta
VQERQARLPLEPFKYSRFHNSRSFTEGATLHG